MSAVFVAGPELIAKALAIQIRKYSLKQDFERAGDTDDSVNDRVEAIEYVSRTGLIHEGLALKHQTGNHVPWWLGLQEKNDEH